MSLATRQWVVQHVNTKFQNDSQKSDILNQNLVQTQTVAMIVFLLHKGHILEFTALRSDHHNDESLSLGPKFCGTHAHGWGFDCWPLKSANAGDYLDATDPRFVSFLEDIRQGPFYLQTGLAGSAYSEINMLHAGPAAFPDDGGDHVHIGAKDC